MTDADRLAAVVRYVQRRTHEERVALAQGLLGAAERYHAVATIMLVVEAMARGQLDDPSHLPDSTPDEVGGAVRL